MSNDSEKYDWVVVGGGMLGMMLSLRLAQQGARVKLLEAAPQLGGLADAWQLGNVTWDRHYHVTLLSDSYLRNLLSELDLENDLQWTVTKTGFLVNNQLYSLSNSWEFLRFPPLNLLDKLRLGWTIFYASKIQSSKALEAIPVGDWLQKLSGKRTFERIWKPLLKAKLGDNYERASAAFIWTTIQRMYAARRTGLKKEMFGYVRGGYSRIIQKFQEKLLEHNVAIQSSAAVREIIKNADGFRITLNSGDTVESKRIIATVPAPVAAKMCPQLNAEEQAKLLGVEYQGIVCASVLLKQSLAPYYVTNITDTVPFTAVIEMSALVDKQEFGNHALIYLPKYVAANHEIWQETNEAIQERFITALEKIYPHFQRDQVVAFRLSRVKHVMPIPTLHYSQHLPPQVTSVPDLYLVNSAHIVNGTLNVNETLKLAEESLQTIHKQASLNGEG